MVDNHILWPLRQPYGFLGRCHSLHSVSRVALTVQSCTRRPSIGSHYDYAGTALCAVWDKYRTARAAQLLPRLPRTAAPGPPTTRLYCTSHSSAQLTFYLHTARESTSDRRAVSFHGHCTAAISPAKGLSCSLDILYAHELSTENKSLASIIDKTADPIFASK